jgi:hypothetical protein
MKKDWLNETNKLKTEFTRLVEGLTKEISRKNE